MKIFEISKFRVQKYLRDMFVNSIGGGDTTPQKLRNLIYKAYGIENATYISPKCFLVVIRCILEKVHLSTTHLFLMAQPTFGLAETVILGWIADLLRGHTLLKIQVVEQEEV